MRVIITGAVLATAALSAPALAQEVGAEGSFSGIYIGAAGSYDVQGNDVGSSILFDRNLDGRFGDTVLTGTGANAFAPSATQPQAGFCNGNANSNVGVAGCRNDDNGFGYYARVGMDTQSGNLVFGAVGEFGRSEITDSTTGFSVTPAAYVFTRSVDWEASIRGRVGYTPNNSTLFYGTFGPSYTKIDNSYRQTQTTNPFATRGKSREWGINAGGGVEQRLGAFSVGLEYMFHQYLDDDYRVRLTGAAGTPFTNAANGGTANGTDFRRSDAAFRWHSVRAVVGFRF